MNPGDRPGDRWRDDRTRPAARDEYQEAPEDDLFIRPFIMTRGRVLPQREELRLESLVVAAPRAADARLEFEERQLVELCASPVSVAELAARTRIPLGVAKVLVADLVVSGMLLSHQPDELPLDLIERIRDHVRAL